MENSDDGFVLLVTGYVDLACCFGVKREGGSTDFDDDSVLFITGHLDLLLCFYFNGVEIKGGNFIWKTDDGSVLFFTGHLDLLWCFCFNVVFLQCNLWCLFMSL